MIDSKHYFYRLIAIILLSCSGVGFSQTESGFQIARVKYSGGGDWYNDPSAEVNLLKYIEEHSTVAVKPEYHFVDISSEEIFNYPFLFLTGHGEIFLSDFEIANLKKHLVAGGFLYIDDDYGLDKSVRAMVKRLFPERELVELPFDYGLYHSVFDFPSGPPKIHEHDNKPPRGYGIFIGERLVLYYTYESNPSDGWADQNVHNDPPSLREKALQFGTNLVVWVLTN